MPLVSFAIATRNAAAFLPQALASIGGAPGGAEVEVVLADGASTDATVTIAAADPRVRIVSRADGGIYDGMNRALAAVRGELVVILNSDDLLLPGAFGAATARMLADPGLGHASGGALFGATPESAVLRRHRGSLTVEGALFGIPAINARLFRTELVRALGPIRTDIGLGADREWLLRLARRRMPSALLAEPFYFYRSHGGSQTLAGGRAGRRRVYEAEARVAAACLAEAGPDPDERRLLHAEYALAEFKLRLTGGGPERLGLPLLGERLRLEDRLRAAALALRWRGRLSGS